MSELYAKPKTFSRQVKAGGAFDMSKFRCFGKFDLINLSKVDDAMVFKKPGHKSIFKCKNAIFCYLGFKTGLKNLL